MTTISMTGRNSGTPRSQFGFISFISFIRSKWQEHQLMRSIESVPYDVMKDVGFPGAERTNEM